MKLKPRLSTLLLLLCTAFLTFGYTTREGANLVSKIYLHGSTLVRTTPGVDIRFYSLATPTNVSQIGQIAIDGNSDVAISGTTMYADQGRDLVVFDISDLANPRAIDTIENVFAKTGDAMMNWNNGIDNGNSFGGASGCGADGCAVDDNSSSSNGSSTGNDQWVIEDDMAGYQTFNYSSNGMSSPVRASNATSGSGSSGTSGGSGASSGGVGGYNDIGSRDGKGGSLARFIIIAKRLYCIDDQDLISFDISAPQKPVKMSQKEIGWNIETIFYANYHLFIGGQRGVYIYDIEDNITPQYRGEFQHVERCDPVVVEGDRAYVTLRGNSECGGWTNQLDILDVSDVTNPKLIKSYTRLDSPYGLAVKDGIALVCDGSSGLRTLDVSDPNNIRECARYSKIKPFDVIWQGDLLIANTLDGFYLYDVSDPCNIREYGLLF